jgi:hypothetical protein
MGDGSLMDLENRLGKGAGEFCDTVADFGGGAREARVEANE